MSYVKFIYLLALAESNLDATKPTLSLKMLFQNDPPSFLSSSKISPHSSVTLSHIIESITNCSVG